MKKYLLALATTSAMLSAAPLAAQTYQGNTYGNQQGNYSGQQGMANRIAQLDARLQAGIQARSITTSEARPIRQQIRQLARLERQYATNGLDQRERQDLQTRLRAVRQQLRAADGGANGRYAEWDNDNYDDNYGNQGYNNQGYNNQGYNNGGNQGGYRQVNEVCGTRGSSGGLGAILGGIFGGNNSNTCLRVGQRLGVQLGALPNEYRGQFRDSNAYYYGYVGGNVVEVQRNSSVVSRIFAVN